jgi:acyl carrier protein
MGSVSSTAVIASIEKSLELSPGTISANTRAEDIATWDSLGHLSVLVGLDELYGGRIASITAMAEADSVPRIFEILRQHALL